jgi:hypothetical protein
VRSGFAVVAGAPLVDDHDGLCFDWRLRPSGTGTEISVHVEIPDAEAHRLDTQRDIIRQSLIRLADLAGATA